MRSAGGPRLVVFTTLFPSPAQPEAGVFIRERMFRVGAHIPLVVVAPSPWFPLQGLLRRWQPHWRPPTPRFEVQGGFEVHRPRFLCFPGVLKSLDGFLLALGSYPTLRRLKRTFAFNVIDAHFGYPDGDAASLLGSWLRTPVAITLRGKEARLARSPIYRALMARSLRRAARVFTVAGSLKRVAVGLGVADTKVRVVGNGVDSGRFYPEPRSLARRALGLDDGDRVLISVGWLVERKGFHRVIERLPSLRSRFPTIRYLIAGGPGPEGDWGERLRHLVASLDLGSCVRFLGPLPPERLRLALSASDLFVLATRYEGWANVLLEAMACGLPVVATDVGGNAEVVSRRALGTLVPLGDGPRLEEAIAEALGVPWDREAIREHARANSWDRRVEVLREEFEVLSHRAGAPGAGR